MQSHIKRLKSDMKSQTKTINKLESKLKMAHSSMHSLCQKLHRSNEAASDASKVKCQAGFIQMSVFCIIIVSFLRVYSSDCIHCV